VSAGSARRSAIKQSASVAWLFHVTTRTDTDRVLSETGLGGR
jgi:hypothetical protein